VSARFEVVRTDVEQPWHARFTAGNGEEVWRSSENYTTKGHARSAILVLAMAFGRSASVDKVALHVTDSAGETRVVPIHYFDERVP
jgi:uncharacterized protein YegP (UPF0339 family)